MTTAPDETNPPDISKSTPPKQKKVWQRVSSVFDVNVHASAETVMSPGHLYFAVIVGWFVEFGYTASSQETWPAALSAFFVVWFASACGFFSGAALGFLFGLPKAMREREQQASQDSGDTESQFSRRLYDNTNLEEISDWLTKIIVGLGIAQFSEIIAFISGVGDVVAVGMGGDEGTLAGNKVLAVSAIIYGTICGLIFYYYWSRVGLFKILQARDRIDTEEAET